MLSDLLAGVLGGLLGDELVERRRRKRRESRLVPGSQGFAAVIPCALRWAARGYPRWRHGSLRLERNATEWRRRFRSDAVVALDPKAMTGESTRDIKPRELGSLNTGCRILTYLVDGTRLELAVLADDLQLVARILEIPPNG